MYTVAASYAHAEGYLSRTDATYTVNNTAYALGATGDYSHSEGDSCGAVGSRSHAENTNTLAVG